jgi:hypothetical protein
MLKSILIEKLPPGPTVAILGTPTGAFGGEDYDDKWLIDNLADHDRPWPSISLSAPTSASRAQPTTQAMPPHWPPPRCAPPRCLRVHLRRLRRHAGGDRHPPPPP